ncbi:MAG: RIP metalloprotease RseP [Burkholderiaceae bacterium]
MTALAFVFGVALLVTIHEYGHYRVARAMGVKVLRFSVGFGRPVWRKLGADGTEWVVGWIPLGGYVRMLDEGDGPVAPAEQAQAFNRQPLAAKAAIVAAGPLANALLAVLLYAALAWGGLQGWAPILATPTQGSLAQRAGVQAQDRVHMAAMQGQAPQTIESLAALRLLLVEALVQGQDVELWVEDARGRQQQRLLQVSALQGDDPGAAALQQLGAGVPYASATVRQVLPQSAAERAGVQVGDQIVRTDGVQVADAADLRQRIARSNGPMQWQVLRNNQTIDLMIRPVVMPNEQGEPVPRAGLMLGGDQAQQTLAYGVWDGLGYGLQRTWQMAELSLRMLGNMLVGDLSWRNLSGPLTVAQVAGQSASAGWQPYVAFLGLMSTSLAVLNLLPIPMLDGGHLMYYLLEAVRRRPLSDVWLQRLQRIGLAVVGTLMGLAIFNDLLRLALA